MSIQFSSLGMLGRLGNSLFQIASTIGIAEKTGTQASFPAWKYEQYFSDALPHTKIDNPIKIAENQFHYDEAIGDKCNGFYRDRSFDIKGYLQSYKYWNKETILKQFEFDETFKNDIKNQFSKALNKPNVAISVRRGDFVNNPNYFQLPITYYLNAYYKHFGSDYNVIVFSDDIAYCKTHFRALPNIYFAELSDIEQLCLMSLCDNHIISNSTFSWWGAYLSQSTNVIRPEKNFAGELAKNSEKDYWPEEWKVFNDYQIDLSDVTFIIPVYYDHADRKQNLQLTLAFLNTYFKTNILIGEQGGNEFESLNEYADYIQFDYPSFHRTKMINELAKQAKTPIIINWDCDNICAPAQLVEAVSAIRDGADISYPFDGCVWRVPRYLFQSVAETLDVFSLNEKLCVKKLSSVGHAVVMNKESFIRSGMENEKFVSWGPEDSERFNRYNILGLNIQRIPGPVMHMDHFIGENSSAKNPSFHSNETEFMNVVRKNKQQLTDYVNGWPWIRDYTKGGVVPSNTVVVDNDSKAGFIPLNEFNKMVNK